MKWRKLTVSAESGGQWGPCLVRAQGRPEIPLCRHKRGVGVVGGQ